jgi:iterative type I PKS product template protein
MAEQCTPDFSGMLACKASASVIEMMLKERNVKPSLDVACRNSSNDCVVSGPLESLISFEETCKKSKVKAKRLDVPCGYHSSAMDSITEPLKALGRSVRWLKPVIPVGSGVHGRLLEIEDCTNDYFAKHARQPVRFSDVINSIDAAGGFRDAQCLEIGPHPTVSSLVQSILASKTNSPIPALKKGQDGWFSLSTLLSQLSYSKDDINWREVFAGSQASVTSLPGYPLRGSEFAIPFHEDSKGSVTQVVAFSDTGFKLLPRIASALSTKELFRFETTTGILGSLISGHDVGGTPICPASVYHEVAMEAAQIAMSLSRDHILVMSNMRFANPLTRRTPNETQTVHVQLHKAEGTRSVEVEILVEKVADSSLISCATTTISAQNHNEIELRWLREAALVKRQLFYFDNTSIHSTFQTKLLYENIFARVVRYSKEYQTLIELKVSSSGLEGIGTFKLPHSSFAENAIISPAFTDTLLHTAGFIANLGVKPTEICICSHVQTIEVLYDDIDPSQTFTIYSQLFDGPKGSLLADAIVINSTGRAVAVAREMEFKRLQLTSFQRLIQSSAPPLQRSIEPLETTSEPSTTGNDTVVSSPSGYGTPKTPESSLDGIKRMISGIFSDACGFSENELDYSKSLDALGIDSLMQIEITGKLKQAFPKSNLAQDTLDECETIQELENTLLSKLMPGDTDSPLEMQTSPLKPHANSLVNGTANGGHSMNPYHDEKKRTESNPVPLNVKVNNGKTPLLCFHDGSGQISMYKKLQDPNRNLYGFFDPDYASNNARPSTLQQMAARYSALVSKSETPSLILCGKSPPSICLHLMHPQSYLQSTNPPFRLVIRWSRSLRGRNPAKIGRLRRERSYHD